MTTEFIDIVVRERGANEAADSVEDLGTKARQTGKSVDGMKRKTKGAFTPIKKEADAARLAVKGLARLTAAVSFVALSTNAVNLARDFKDSTAEVSTLVDTATFGMNRLEQSALRQASAFGSQPATQMKAFYQIISAGADSASRATEILEASNKLAVGGVTDLTVAADGLTSLLNAYGPAAGSATDVSNALFVAMRSGKTTIGELSSSVGKLAPLAASTGVSLDEMLGSVAALTKGGIATTEAVTGVRAILASVAKPTKEAQDAAKRLGIDFSAAGLQAQGFQGFLNSLATATKGNTAELAQFFGGVEALVPIMALSGTAGQDFSTILDQMGVKAGATEDAFNKMARSPGFQFQRLASTITAASTKAGSVLLTVLAPAAKIIADNFQVLSIAAIAMTANFLVAATASGGMATAMGVAAIAARALWTAITGPVGLVVAGVLGVIAVFKKFENSTITAGNKTVTLGQIWDGVVGGMVRLWDASVSKISEIWNNLSTFFQGSGSGLLSFYKGFMNKTIGVFVGGFNLIKEAWNQLASNLPNVLKAAGQAAVDALRVTVQTTLNILQSPLALIEKLSDIAGKPIQLPRLEIPKFQLFDSAEVAQVGTDLKSAFLTGFNQDFIGNAITKTKQLLVSLADTSVSSGAALTNALNGVTTVSGGSGGGSGAINSTTISLQELNKAYSALGQPLADATSAVNKINDLLKNGIITQTEHVGGMQKIKQAYLDAGGTVESFANTMEKAANLSAAGKIAADLQKVRKPIQEITAAQQQLKQAFEEGSVSVQRYQATMSQLNTLLVQAGGSVGGGQQQGGFFSSFLTGLGLVNDKVSSVTQNMGASFGETFANIATSASNAFGQAIVSGENLGSALKDVARQGLASIISGLVKMGLQFVINAALGKALGAGAVAASSTQAGILASTWAAPAALASLATLGANAAPASAAVATTTALTKGIAVAGAAFAKGGSFGKGAEFFANGGVFNSPTAFGFSNKGKNKLGIMGEAGPEAVLPLRRGRGGKLGVTANVSGAGGTTALNVQVQNFAPGVTHQVEQIGPNEMRVIARQEAGTEINKRTPRLMQREFKNSNSRTSSSMQQNFSVARKRR